MSTTDILEQIRQLSPDEKRNLAERIWEELDDGCDLTPEQLAELERRSKEARDHLERCIPFEQIAAEIEKKFGSTKCSSISTNVTQRDFEGWDKQELPGSRGYFTPWPGPTRFMICILIMKADRSLFRQSMRAA
jgi:putative addiction module component (TIGR02574 family)